MIAREWKNKAGDIIATIEEGTLKTAEIPPSPEVPHGRCAEFVFSWSEDQTWPSPYCATLYCDGDVVRVDNPDSRAVFWSHMSRLEDAVRYVEGHLPLRNPTARLTLTERVNRSEAWETRGALTPTGRSRLRRLYNKLGTSVSVLITETDLRPGYTFELLRAARDWRSHGPRRIGWYLDRFHNPETVKSPLLTEFLARDRAEAEKAVADFRLLMAESTPARLREHALDWLKWNPLPCNPLDIDLDNPPQAGEIV